MPTITQGIIILCAAAVFFIFARRSDRHDRRAQRATDEGRHADAMNEVARSFLMWFLAVLVLVALIAAHGWAIGL